MALNRAPDGSWKKTPEFRYLLEPQPGLDNTRNRAVCDATESILVFTDDDVILDRELVTTLANAFFSDGSVGMVTEGGRPVTMEQNWGGTDGSCAEFGFPKDGS